jgi:hypothetical protein
MKHARTKPLIGAVVVILLCIVYSGVCFDFSPLGRDETSYLFQAKLFAQGRLAAEAPPSFGFSPSLHINILDGSWHSKYPFGHALALALGVWVGAPWLIPALATGGAVYLLYLILLETFDARTAVTGLVVAVLSPQTFVLGALWFSEAVDRFFVGLFLYAALRAFRTPRPLWGAISGLALGYAFNTRPLTAVAIGGTAVLFLWLGGEFRAQWRGNARIVGGIAIGAALIASLMLVWNFKTTGDVFRVAHRAQQPFDRLGFGPRANSIHPDGFMIYTPAAAARRLALRTTPAVLQNSLGIGFYDSQMYGWLTTAPLPKRFLVAIGIAGLLIPLWLACRPLLQRRPSSSTILFALLPVASALAYSMYWWEGASFTPRSTRYHAEAVMFGVLPLIARGLVLFWDQRGAALVQSRRAWAIAIMALLLANYCFNNYRYFTVFANDFRYASVAARALATVPSNHAVVFFDKQLVMPIGDYPYATMQQARVITFRLTCSPSWNLHECDVVDTYRRYFQGRDAFLFTQDLELRRLDMSLSPPGT